jgi:DNA (cytosine-5)-methyltransferase 1
LRSPKASEGSGGALGEAEALKRGNTVGVRDQVMDLVSSQGLPVTRVDKNLLPTPAVGHIRNHDEPIEDYLGRRQDYLDGKTKGMPGASLGVAVRMNWGKYESAIRRWEEVLGRPAPAPTNPDGKDGAHRLAAEFVEWMMGLPEGWVTDPSLGLKRNDQLKALGNGVVPQQAKYALQLLLDDETIKKIGKK